MKIVFIIHIFLKTSIYLISFFIHFFVLKLKQIVLTYFYFVMLFIHSSLYTPIIKLIIFNFYVNHMKLVTIFKVF